MNREISIIIEMVLQEWNGMNKQDTVMEKSKRFAVHIMQLVEYLARNKRPFFIVQQIGKTGTSIGANIVEAEHAISKKDFLLKMYISYKECNETLYWLDLLKEIRYISEEQYDFMKKQCVEIEKMLAAITRTTKSRINS